MDTSTRKNLLLLAIIFIVSNPVYAYFPKHWYIAGFLGKSNNVSGDTKIPSIVSRPPLTSEPVYQTGNTFEFAFGNQVISNFRIEGMMSYQDLPMNKINNAIGQGTVTYVNDSYTRLFSFFANAYYDFNSDPAWIVHPYIGLGGGYVNIKNMIRPASPIPVAPGIFFTKKELNYATFGYQGIFGITYPLSKNFLLDLNYKYFATLKKETTGFTNLGSDQYQTSQKISDNMISLGVRYYFNPL